MTAAENDVPAMPMKKQPPMRRRPVEAYGADGQPLGQWGSTLQAAAETGYSRTVIKNCAGCRQRDCETCSYFRKYRVTWKYAAPAV